MFINIASPTNGLELHGLMMSVLFTTIPNMQGLAKVQMPPKTSSENSQTKYCQEMLNSNDHKKAIKLLYRNMVVITASTKIAFPATPNAT
jgi:hypothetical protein